MGSGRCSGGAGGLLGGVFAELLSWEWIFFVNVPFWIAAFALTPELLAENGGRGQSFDLPGATLVTGGLVALVYAFVSAGTQAGRPPETLVVFAAGGRALVAFVAREPRASIR